MEKLKELPTVAPTLIILDSGPSTGMIYLTVDKSTTIRWGATLEQLQDDGKRKPARYESGVWNDVERKYDAVKLECRGLLKALKKLRFWLIYDSQSRRR
jgi:RNase H-like domain found in reverse transcriptase